MTLVDVFVIIMIVIVFFQNLSIDEKYQKVLNTQLLLLRGVRALLDEIEPETHIKKPVGFPDDPSKGDTHVFRETTYVFDGEKWIIKDRYDQGRETGSVH
jgi:hypothetical protein